MSELDAGTHATTESQYESFVLRNEADGFTLFLRTFLPWQIWRFIRINLKMLVIIRPQPQRPLNE